MRIKENYTAPRIEMIPMQIESLLDTLSLPTNNNSSDSGGDAKSGDFFDEDTEQSVVGYQPWREEDRP